MMGRFSDAMRNFEQILLYLARTRNHSKGALFDAVKDSKTLQKGFTNI